MDACVLETKARMRTTKPRGSDVSTLTSSWRQCSRIAPVTVTRKPDRREERGISRKTIARGMPGVSGATCGDYLCAFYLCTQGCGRTLRPAFPAPSDGQRTMQASGRISPARGNCRART
jgi:hypothetical protein